MSNDSSSNAPQLFFPLFEGNDYDIWALKMRTILIGCDLWDYVENGYDESNANNKEHRKNDAVALSYIQLALRLDICRRISDAKKAKEAWDILKKEFQGTSKVPPQTPRGDHLAPKGTNNVDALLVIGGVGAAAQIVGAGASVVRTAYDIHHGSSLTPSSTGGDNLFACANDGAASDHIPSFMEGVLSMFGN